MSSAMNVNGVLPRDRLVVVIALVVVVGIGVPLQMDAWRIGWSFIVSSLASLTSQKWSTA